MSILLKVVVDCHLPGCIIEGSSAASSGALTMAIAPHAIATAKAVCRLNFIDLPLDFLERDLWHCVRQGD
ncbi:hypothetical protein GCM10011371_09280 [Novosphingobium marinum]|nr:hypothetical protein GCM10011371_09280 [Novosphingobium marinum]